MSSSIAYVRLDYQAGWVGDGGWDGMDEHGRAVGRARRTTAGELGAAGRSCGGYAAAQMARVGQGDVMEGAVPFGVGELLPSDQRDLVRWLEDLSAKADAR